MIPQITAKSIASSMTEDGDRIDTLQLRYPRMVHADFMTHRVFSRNASSSRAIPHTSLTVRDADIYVPQFRVNQPGMQPGGFLTAEKQAEAELIWREMADFILEKTRLLAAKDGLNIHKQWVNRPLEWFGYIEVVVTATNWSNFDALRDHTDAQDEIMHLAQAIKQARAEAQPKLLGEGEWHLPYVTEQDRADVAELVNRRRFSDFAVTIIDTLCSVDNMNGLFERVTPETALLLAISTARCCRVSYSKHDGKRPEIDTDLELYLRLAGAEPLHASPLEHQARIVMLDEPDWVQGNFQGFAQFRKFVPNECL
ncbi:putative flavin-dependent thymidylate synthase [Brevundimonas phage vB_BpoS-Kikimora]|uniref:Flavin-dependent thymidylate synthase n=1 Tax=Brevundimonas phage vB_BpoS-Kikimora TaxID=2948601 RepID=A0A9E7SLE4_9CAUD|nr:putative flavin-dependent thymidylate synthase [Brevundimonas phage vB_BpoS-Kikimora]